ncbi:MAG: hypothetical protein IKC17_01700 [Bacteroidales bacterium]|nr:hypothetical protein [Bacteroidales bacterium]
MDITIKFQEITNLLKRVANADVCVKYIDTNSIQVIHNAQEGSAIPSFDVKLKFEFVGENKFKLHYQCDESLSAMVVGLLAMANMSGVGINSADKYIQIDLNAVEVAEPFVSNASFADIVFDEEGLLIKLPIK